MTFTFDLETWSKIVKSFYVKYELDRATWENKYALKKNCEVKYDLDLWLKALCTWSTMYEQYWTKGRECMIWTCFSHNSAMTLTLNLETWFKVTAHPLPKGALDMLMKYEPDWANGTICPKKVISGRQMDGRTDWSL